jgi:general secretion pathway protein C
MASIPLRDWRELPKTLGMLYERHGRWLPAALELLLVILVARLLAELVWALVPVPAAAAWKPAPAAAAPPAAAAIDVNRIVAAQLFGVYQPPANPAAAALEAAPETQLNLTLLGIFANAHDPKGSRALIGSGSDEKPYAVGDEVARGVILKAIFADRVVLSRNGRLETLRLDKDKASSAPAPSEPATAESQGSEGTEPLAAIRNKLLANPQLTANYIRVQPVNNGSALIGYRVYPGGNRSLFTDSGLHPGDVVTAINGVQLDDPAKSLQLLSELSQASSLSLVVQRGGESQTLNINLNQ